jgi:two-component system, NarL family, sensor histidine kinase UhpB
MTTVKSIKVLILEHDENDLELLLYELKKGKLDFVPKIVETKEQFSNALTDFCPDIILSDYSLPGFDGVTAFNIKQEICPEVPFIIVSGTIGEENAVELIKNGVTDYALKDK